MTGLWIFFIMLILVGIWNEISGLMHAVKDVAAAIRERR